MSPREQRKSEMRKAFELWTWMSLGAVSGGYLLALLVLSILSGYRS